MPEEVSNPVNRYPFDIRSASLLLDALSNPVRLGIAQLLSKEHLTVASLAARLEMSPAAISQHLQKMRAAKIVGTERNGQTIIYSLPLHSEARKLMDAIDL